MVSGSKGFHPLGVVLIGLVGQLAALSSLPVVVVVGGGARPPILVPQPFAIGQWACPGCDPQVYIRLLRLLPGYYTHLWRSPFTTPVTTPGHNVCMGHTKYSTIPDTHIHVHPLHPLRRNAFALGIIWNFRFC